MIAKSPADLENSAKEFLKKWKELGFETPYYALEEWEAIIFKIAQGGDIAQIKEIKKRLFDWLVAGGLKPD